MQGPAGAERLRGTWVTPNFFETLGARAQTGRAFTSADRDARVTVISDGLWRRRFGADPRIIGQTVSISVGRGAKRAPQPFTVVGVMAADFRFTYPRETEIYLPKPWHDIRDVNALTYYVVGRLEDGIAPAQAQSRADCRRPAHRQRIWMGARRDRGSDQNARRCSSSPSRTT